MQSIVYVPAYTLSSGELAPVSIDSVINLFVASGVIARYAFDACA